MNMAITKNDAIRELARRELERRKSVKQTAPEDISIGKKIYRSVGKFLPSAGGVVGGIIGGAGGTVGGLGVGGVPGAIGGAGLGSATGEAARQLFARSVGEEAPPTSMEALKNIGVEGAYGVAGEAVGPVAGKIAKPILKPMGKGAARVIEAVTGMRQPDIISASKRGVRSYFDPSIGKAEKIFESAIKKSGGKITPTMEQIYDPQLSQARKLAISAGNKLLKNKEVNAGELLRAKQATDRVIAATPLQDRQARKLLFEQRNVFDAALSGKSGELKKASDIYRKSIVRSKLLSPFRLTKSGQLSATAPLIATSIGSAVGVGDQAPEKGLRTGLAVLGATSPAVWGAGITAGSDIARALTSPIGRRAIGQSMIRSLLKKQRKKEE